MQRPGQKGGQSLGEMAEYYILHEKRKIFGDLLVEMQREWGLAIGGT